MWRKTSRIKKRTSKGNGKNKTDKVKIKWHKSSRGQQTMQMQTWREKTSCSRTREKKHYLHTWSSHPYGQHVSSKDKTPSSDQDIKQKDRRKPNKSEPGDHNGSHHKSLQPPIKSFTACPGGESVAEMIHHCSVSQITDRPSPPHCSSEPQIN